MVGMTVSTARARWTAAGFTGSFAPATGAGKDAETVIAQVTSPSSNPGDCMPKTSTVSVTSTAPPTCTAPDRVVPNLFGLTVANARTSWTTAGFTGSFSPASGSDTLIVDGQNPTRGDCKPASSTMTVTFGAGPPPPTETCVVPQLVGRDADAAQADFTVAGFTGAYIKAQTGSFVIQFQSLIGGQPYPCISSITVGAVQP
jgi:beta-lactam-binding protein with PASTA domain